MAGKRSTNLKATAATAIDDCKVELQELGSDIWGTPELGFEEVYAHKRLTDFLENKGFKVDRSYHPESGPRDYHPQFRTAFRATFGSGRPNLCVLCEYDALPDIHHACGHNLIAEAGVAAGLGLKAALETRGAPQARITILGTPAEEGGGGKVYLIENGALADVDLAMMVHPTSGTIICPLMLARQQILATFTGLTAHAAGAPWEGKNAVDAAVIAYNAISVLRQQMKPTWRVHGIFSDGGVKPNIIPDKSELYYWIRTPTAPELTELHEKLTACFKAGAAAAGCDVEIHEPKSHKKILNLVSNPTLARLYEANFTSLGQEIDLFAGGDGGSTDMGNVSHKVPSIHPVYKIGSGLEKNHTHAFTAVANEDESHARTLFSAKAMAYTCIDMLTVDGAMEEMRESFEETVLEESVTAASKT